MAEETLDLLSTCPSLNNILWFAGYENVSKCMRLNKTIHAHIVANAMPKKLVQLNIDICCRDPQTLSLQFFEKTRRSVVCEARFQIQPNGEMTYPDHAPVFLRHYIETNGAIKHNGKYGVFRNSFALPEIDDPHSALRFLLDTYLPRLNVHCLILRSALSPMRAPQQTTMPRLFINKQELEIIRDCFLQCGGSRQKHMRNIRLEYDFREELLASIMEIARAMKADICMMHGNNEPVRLNQLDTTNYRHFVDAEKWDTDDIETILKEWISGQRDLRGMELLAPSNASFHDLCDRMGKECTNGPFEGKQCSLHFILKRSYGSVGVFYYRSANKLEIESIRD